MKLGALAPVVVHCSGDHRGLALAIVWLAGVKG